VQPHQSSNPVATGDDLLGSQGMADPWRSVVGEAAVDQPDLLEQLLISGGPTGRWLDQALAPVVKPRRRDAEQSTDDGDIQIGILGLLRVDIAVDRY
jgi:hypothetical protein